MMMTLIDAVGLTMLGAHMFATTRGHPAARGALAVMTAAPVGALAFALGPPGIALIACATLVFGRALNALEISQAGRAHFTAGLCAGLLFATGPFGAVLVGATLTILAFGSRGRRSDHAVAVDIAILMFVPIVVIAGFAVAAQAQFGDAFALTAPRTEYVSRLAVWLPQWPSALVAILLLPVLAPNALAHGGASLALLGGGAAALITFRGTIDGIVEAALVAAVAANAIPVERLMSRAVLILVAGNAGVFTLAAVVHDHAGKIQKPPYATWHIAPPGLEKLPPWGIDDAR